MQGAHPKKGRSVLINLPLKESVFIYFGSEGMRASSNLVPWSNNVIVCIDKLIYLSTDMITSPNKQTVVRSTASRNAL
ncbi:jg16892 [Pararge aegeria aegeria]|uniref:Jg16892 protein n=1 Tax=Pararge aegeria aegeria TaxID=348720 RepID=A0A8S4SPL1_9NEOP|nr:jg16892 [Pararge aegeria aegeria]